MDNDVSNPISNGTFSNVAVFEPGFEPDPDPNPDPDPVPDAINFNQFTFSNYGTRQNPAGAGILEVLDGGIVVRLSGNLWQKLEINQTLTADSILEFEFRSNTEGEIHGIGFNTSNGVNSGRTFQLFGSQTWGNTDFNYNGSGDFQTFTIPIGTYYIGEYRYLFFSMDHDVSNADGESVFRNVVIR